MAHTELNLRERRAIENIRVLPKMSDTLAVFDMDGVIFATDRAKREVLAECSPSREGPDVCV